VYSQSDRKEKADELFDQGKFVEAFGHYTQLLANNPRNEELNFKYAVCYIFKGEFDSIDEPLKHLDYAKEKGFIDKKFDFYVAIAYEQIQDFEKAIEFYQNYLRTVGKQEAKELEIKKRIKKCKKASKKNRIK
jgi:tetratricopeptide (TPR) repeat protein